MRVQCIKSIKYVEDTNERFTAKCMNIYVSKFNQDRK